MENLNELIGEPLEIAQKKLEEKGYEVVVKINSLPKIQTDYKLVTLARKLNDKEVELIVGDFLINIENKIN